MQSVSYCKNGVVVGSGITLSKDGDGVFYRYCHCNFIVGSGSGLTGVASTDNIRTNTNATFLQNINVSGTVTATSYAGSGANLTNLPAAQLTGTLPAISGANLTGIVSWYYNFQCCLNVRYHNSFRSFKG